MSDQIDGLFITFSPGESEAIEKALSAKGYSFDSSGIKKCLLKLLKPTPRASIDKVIADLEQKVINDPQAVYDVMDTMADSAINFIGNLLNKPKIKKPRE
jgi:hypothetical protein